jgi:hypothetical protein
LNNCSDLKDTLTLKTFDKQIFFLQQKSFSEMKMMNRLWNDRLQWIAKESRNYIFEKAVDGKQYLTVFLLSEWARDFNKLKMFYFKTWNFLYTVLKLTYFNKFNRIRTHCLRRFKIGKKWLLDEVYRHIIRHEIFKLKAFNFVFKKAFVDDVFNVFFKIKLHQLQVCNQYMCCPRFEINLY